MGIFRKRSSTPSAETLAAMQAAEASSARAEEDLARAEKKVAESRKAVEKLRHRNAANHYDEWIENKLLGLK